MLICLIIKKLNPIVTELFIRGRKLKLPLVFITQSYFAVPKDIRINFSHYLIIKIPNKQELHRFESHHSSDIDFKDFINLYKKCTAKLYSFLVIDATLASDNPSRFIIIDDKIRDEKLQYNIKRGTAKISALSSGKIDKYECLNINSVIQFHCKENNKQHQHFWKIIRS